MKKQTRLQRSVELLVKRTATHKYIVSSQKNRNVLYEIDTGNNTCTCNDFKYRNLLCKHLHACKLYELGERK